MYYTAENLFGMRSEAKECKFTPPVRGNVLNIQTTVFVMILSTVDEFCN